jgi:hypothetical protein
MLQRLWDGFVLDDSCLAAALALPAIPKLTEEDGNLL